MVSSIQFLYYASGTLLALLGALGVVKSASSGTIKRASKLLDRIESIEESVDEIASSQQDIRETQQSMQHRQDNLTAAIIAAVRSPQEVDPESIEEALSDDDAPSPNDFTNGTGVNWPDRSTQKD